MAFSTTPTEGNDRLRATADGQTINALGGNDWIRSTLSGSTLYGGLGHDRISVALDLLEPTVDDFTRSADLYGGNGNDWLVSEFLVTSTDQQPEFSFSFTSLQSGGSGNDNIYISAFGEEAFYPIGRFSFEVLGGAGEDNIWIEAGGPGVYNHNVVDAGSGADTVYISFEASSEWGSSTNEIYAGTGDDDLTIGGEASWMDGPNENSAWGEDGNDRIEVLTLAAGSINKLYGGAGDDTLIADGISAGDPGGSLESSAWGGVGNDTINLTGRGSSLSDRITHAAYGEAGDDTITSRVGGGTNEPDDYLDADAMLDGGAGADVLTASTAFSPEDELVGGARLYGRTGNDILRVYGGVENTLDGGNGDDTITGGSGADRIIGGAGADALRGGGGNDSFVFLWAAGATPAIRDTIFDFGIGTAARGADVINLSTIDANVNRGGNQSFAFGSQAGVGRLWVEDDPDSASSLVMANNGGEQMLVIAVQDWSSRDAADWLRGDFVL